MDPTLDPGLVVLSLSLLTVARNVSVPGDLPAIIDLLTQSVDVFLRGGNYDNTTFSVSWTTLYNYVATIIIQNLIEVGSELLHLRNQPLWSEANTVRLPLPIIYAPPFTPPPPPPPPPPDLRV